MHIEVRYDACDVAGGIRVQKLRWLENPGHGNAPDESGETRERSGQRLERAFTLGEKDLFRPS